MFIQIALISGPGPPWNQHSGADNEGLWLTIGAQMCQSVPHEFWSQTCYVTVEPQSSPLIISSMWVCFCSTTLLPQQRSTHLTSQKCSEQLLDVRRRGLPQKEVGPPLSLFHKESCEIFCPLLRVLSTAVLPALPPHHGQTPGEWSASLTGVFIDHWSVVWILIQRSGHLDLQLVWFKTL